MDVDLSALRAQAFNYLFDAVVVTDAAGIVIDWNCGSQQLYGYRKEDIIGQPVSLLHVPEDSASITDLVISSVEQHGKWTGEIRFLHKDGSIGWVESMCVPLFDNNQQFIGALGINRDITKRIEDAQQLLNLACYDQLTQIPNRHLLMDRVKHSIERCKRLSTKFSLFYLDLDDFKKINDTYGHCNGDKVLIETVARLNEVIRESDTLARMGGDEFVLLLEDIEDNNDNSHMADLLISALDKQFTIDEQKILLNCSVGIATFPDSGDDFDTLIKAADFAMYKSKRQGGATYRFG
ncbi:sensor domain-containing diguanylate cyclase [uncultured Shewanella sp.]|uniref:sensor domain-containing diguanylate cyclase n=1 Tax=uncultured Shewanella sp. TaxID=173975 RepID=UPI0026191DFB|nr:sensor domain-containing diguanylate cyclase [uncultured Shewanella sp.]